MANLETTVELNKLLKEQNKILEAQAKVMKSQATIMKSIVDSLQKISGMDTTESLNEMNKALKDADKALEDLSGTQQKAFGEVNKAGKMSNKMFDTMTNKIKTMGKSSAKVAVLITAFSGLNAGVRLGIGAFTSMLSIAGTLAKSFFNLGASIIALPFKLLNSLMATAAEYSGTELRQAIEDLRGEMGDLASNEGKAVMDSFRGMRKEGTMTGLGLHKVFGNMAERLKELTRIAMAMGRGFTGMTDEFMSHGRQIGEYVKGLGLSEEGIKAVTNQALASGKQFIEVGREMTTMAFGMGDAFGISGKLISKDIAEMAGDFENFGSVGVKQMSQISVFTRKLGIDIKDLLGVVGKFDDFEQAAQSAAQLSQAFGLQIDTLEMLKEQDPAARFETLRKAFLSTGKSVENLTRQELNLLSSQTGISQEALKLGFSQSKMGTSYEEIQKQSEKTEKKQLSQAEAMEKLSDSIQVLVKSGEKMEGGFFNIFLQGMGRGMKHSEQFHKLMRTLHTAMRGVYEIGRRVGHEFMRLFPGVNEIFTELNEVFKKIGGTGRHGPFGFLKVILEDFKKFFKVMSSDPKVALKALFKDMQTHFFDNFKDSSTRGKNILNGFKKFFKTMASLFSVGVEMAMHGFSSGLHFLSDFIKNPAKFLSGAGGAGSGAVGFAADILSPIFKAIVDSWPELKHAFVELWQTAVKYLGPHVDKFVDTILGYLKKAAVSAAISRVVLSSLMFGLAKVGESIVSKGSPLLGKAFSKMFESTSKLPDVKKGTEKMQSALFGTSEMSKSMKTADSATGKVNWKALGKNILVGVLAIAAVAAVMAGTFYLMKSSLSGVNLQDIEKAGKVITTGAIIFAAAAASIVIAAATGAFVALPGVMPAALLGFASLTATVVGMVAGVKEIIKEISTIQMSAGLEQKVGVFTKVAKTMTDFGGMLLNMIRESTPSFSGLIGLFRGTNPMAEGLKAVNEIMKTMAVELKSIVTLIATTVSGVKPEQLAAGEMIGTILGAMSEFMKSLMPPPEFSPDFMDRLLDQSSFGRVAGFIKGLMTSMKENMIPAISQMLSTISGMPAIDKSKVETFTMFMTGIGALIQAMKPSEGMTNLLKETENNSFWSKLIPWGKKQEAAGKATGPVSGVLDGMMSNLMGPNGIMTKIQGLMGSMAKTIAGMGDTEKIKSSTELFSSVMAAVTSVAQLFSDEGMKDFQTAVSSGNTKSMFADFNANILIPMNEDLPMMFDGFSQLNNNINMAKKMFVGKVSGGVKDMVSEINSISTSLNSLEPIKIKTSMKDLSDKLGLKGKEELKINLNDINITINVEVALDADKFEEALRTRPGGSKFVINGSHK